MPDNEQLYGPNHPKGGPCWSLDQRAETESHPAMEVHLGEAYIGYNTNQFSEGKDLASPARHCIIWHNGKRWEGTLFEEPERKTH